VGELNEEHAGGAVLIICSASPYFFIDGSLGRQVWKSPLDCQRTVVTILGYHYNNNLQQGLFTLFPHHMSQG